MSKARGGLALTTRNGEDNKLLEEAIRANGQLKENYYPSSTESKSQNNSVKRGQGKYKRGSHQSTG